ncbi:MAG: sugar ABC transporter ATP-binding protein [Acidobacteria bacterium]|nr:sugar ABC transporter ATP-binding protein [Acidobacteriota bacterium]
MTAPLLAGRGIRKSFGAAPVLRDVTFEVRPGEVHVLIGANGAGKSTLVKILYGALRPELGDLYWKDTHIPGGDLRHTAARGVAYIPQEIEVIPHLSLTENLFLGNPVRRAGWLVDHTAQAAAAASVLARVGIRRDLETKARDLSVAEQQLLMIGRALVRRVEVVILDEPTASLAPAEVENLFAVIRQLRESGVGILYISHRLDEIRRIGDRVSVLRGGALVFTGPASTPKQDLIRQMIGHDVEPGQARMPVTAAPALELRHGNLGARFRDVSFTAYSGEVLAFTGLIGAGRTSLARALFGAEPGFIGELRVHGEVARFDSPQQAIARGLALLTENPKEQGLVLTADVATNISLPNASHFSRWAWLDHRKETAVTTDYARKLAVDPPDVRRLVRLLSGGNQQKVVIARWLLSGARILLFDEPTRGIDIGAKEQVYDWIRRLAGEGKTVLLFSSETEEVLRLADRILVMRLGHITAEFPAAEATEEKILRAAFS